MNQSHVLIDTRSSLTKTCRQLQGCARLAVDTEFERVNTYYPELCLVQVAGDNGAVAVIDPLAMDDLEPLYALLYDPAITKVFHAARQDFELFFHLRGELPAPLFDTQIAASLLGYDQQIGYANLVREMLDVDLAKTQTRTDWKRRPLGEKQLEYAADDVIYLARLHERLQTRLMESELMSKLEEQCRLLNRPELYEPDPDTMWKKIKIREAQKFNGASLAVFKRLAAWREITARRKNLPRKWVLKDHELVAIARELPADREALSRLEGVDERVMKRYGDELLRLCGIAAKSLPRGQGDGSGILHNDEEDILIIGGCVPLSRHALSTLAQRYNIKRLALFGSAARGELAPDSDIDVLVEFLPEKAPSLGGLSKLREALRQLFNGREVDVSTPAILNNPYRRREIEKDMAILYETPDSQRYS